MKKTYILSPIVMGVAGLIWMSASGGVADVQKKDRTGSPVSDTDCTQCHLAGGNFSTVPTIQIADAGGNGVTEYIPGETYTVTVDIQSSGSDNHGFQITGLLGDNTSAGTCVANSPNTQITPLNGRWYFEQSSTALGGSYQMTWTAPAAGSGKVDFYGVALTVNGNGTTSGDEFANIPMTSLSEANPNGIEDLQAVVGLELYPNPVTDQLTVSSKLSVERIDLFTITGKLVFSETVNGTQDQLDISSLNKGVYVIKVTTESGVVSQRILKQ